MKTLLRILLVLITAAAGLFFTYWMVAALLTPLKAPDWAGLYVVPIGVAAVVAIAAARFVWLRTAEPQGGLLASIAVGAFVTGAIGFALGFFGPILFMPEANQGPLLGLFFTGPLGFVLGGLGGAVYWLVSGRRAKPAVHSDSPSA